MRIRTLTGMVALSAMVALGCEVDVSEPADVDLAAQFDGETGVDLCSEGDARALLESLPVANQVFLREGPDQPWAQTLLTCQYRLFWESGHPVLGQPVSFDHQDTFLGGVVFIVPYKNLGMTKHQAAAILRAIDVQIGLAEATEAGLGELVDQPVMESVVKQADTDDLGLIVWKQWGYITQLRPGEYVSVTEVDRPVFFEDEFFWTVNIQIS